MAGRIVLFGATGYTGSLIATRLVEAGARPLLAGRDPARLEELAARLGGLDTAKADVYRQNAIYSLIEPGDVLVSTVGPFAKYGTVAVGAAIAAGATYLDTTGEPAFIRHVFEDFHPNALRAGTVLLTAMGYDFVPGALAGALALREAGDAAVRVDVAYYAFGGGPEMASAGTKESLVGATLDPGFAYRGGRLVTERGAARVRGFRVGGKDRPAISVGGAEHFTLPAAFPQLREVNAYIGGFGPLARAVQAGSLASSLVTRVPGTRNVLQYAGERLAAMAPTRGHGDEGSARTAVVGEAYDGAGRRLASVTLEGVDPYAFTGRFLAWAAQRAAAGEIEGRGALSPVVAFGLDGLRDGVAAAGIAPAAVGTGA